MEDKAVSKKRTQNHSRIKVGIDEAGRGPFIGPMVMAGMAFPENQLPKGITDSKLLTPAKREELYFKLKPLPHAVRICEPAEIDEWVAQGKLNWLEAQKTVEIINELLGENPDKDTEVIVDCPAKNLEMYKAWIAERIPKVKLIVQYKADLNHKIVGAASIIAKVTRDRIIADMRNQVGFDFGSGYLTDPKTQAFLKEFNPDYKGFRKSWQTYKDLIEKSEQKTLF